MAGHAGTSSLWAQYNVNGGIIGAAAGIFFYRVSLSLSHFAAYPGAVCYIGFRRTKQEIWSSYDCRGTALPRRLIKKTLKIRFWILGEVMKVFSVRAGLWNIRTAESIG
jgi:hypothetical protein